MVARVAHSYMDMEHGSLAHSYRDIMEHGSLASVEISREELAAIVAGSAVVETTITAAHDALRRSKEALGKAETKAEAKAEVEAKAAAEAKAKAEAKAEERPRKRWRVSCCRSCTARRTPFPPQRRCCRRSQS